MNKSSHTIRPALAAVWAILAVPTLHAQFATDFESPTYAAASGVDGWTTGFGSASQMTVSTANPYGGSQHFRLDNNSTSQAFSLTNNFGAGFVDKTADVLAGAGLGDIPHRDVAAGDIPNIIILLSRTNDTAIFDVDAISISQIPEPSAFAFLAGLSAISATHRSC